VRRIFAFLAALQALAVIAQFFLAASGAFATGAKDESFEPHRSLGYGIAGFAILLTIVAALARKPRRVIGMTALVAGLVVVQSLIRVIADSLNDGDASTWAGQLVFGLHAVNGLVILSVAVTIARRAWAASRSTAAVQSARADNTIAGGAR